MTDTLDITPDDPLRQEQRPRHSADGPAEKQAFQPRQQPRRAFGPPAANDDHGPGDPEQPAAI